MLSPGLRTALAEALSLVFPTWCAGCDLPGVPLCEDCAAALGPDPRMRRLPDGLPVYSALAFDGVAARVIRALKEEGRTALAGPLGTALGAAVDAAAVLAAPADAARAAAGVAGGLHVVPVPTSRAALRRRGYRVAELVAARAGLVPERLLRAASPAADQRGLGRAERARNVADTMRSRGAAGRRILLVDDVVTTGATLTEAARALRADGAEVIAAATIAATARHGIVTAVRT